jgi:hypothetical protein
MRSRTIQQARIIVLGYCGAGKTSLIECLLGEKKNLLQSDEPQIHHGEIRSGSKNLSITIWEFGMDDYDYKTYRLFFTDDTIYIVVVDASEKLEAINSKTNHWINEITNYTMQAPIIVVFSKVDKEVHRKDSLNKLVFDNKRVGLPLHLSLLNKKDAHHDLADKLFDVLHDESYFQPITENPFWEQMIDSIHRQSQKRNYLAHRDFNNLLTKAGIHDDEDKKVIKEKCHRDGLAFNYQITGYETIYVLKPNWFTSVVKHFFEIRDLYESYGVIDKARLPTYFPNNFPDSVCHYLIHLFKEYDIVLEIDDDRFLIPNMQQHHDFSDDFRIKAVVSYVYDYYFMPQDISFKLAAVLFNKIHKNNFWKNEIVLAQETCKAYMFFDYDKNRIEVFITGEDKEHIRELWYEIKLCFRKFSSIYQPIANSKLPKEQLFADEVVVSHQQIITNPASPNYITGTIMGLLITLAVVAFVYILIEQFSPSNSLAIIFLVFLTFITLGLFYTVIIGVISPKDFKELLKKVIDRS